MANIKDLKKRIRSTKSTLKITSAMKLVSAAKLAKAQSSILSIRPYVSELEHTIQTASALTEGYTHEFTQSNSSKNRVLLVISSDKGLCGPYNSQVTKVARKYIQEHGQSAKIFFIGKKAKEILVKEDINEGKQFTFKRVDPTVEEIRGIATEFSKLFTIGEVGVVDIAYNSFQSAIACEAVVKQVLPMSMDEEASAKLKEEYPFDFKYEPSAESILDKLIPEVYFNSIYTCVLDAIASEHGSRMSSMENASKNCKDMIKQLTLKMNKLRQAAITTELIEVVSGAESLKG